MEGSPPGTGTASPTTVIARADPKEIRVLLLENVHDRAAAMFSDENFTVIRKEKMTKAELLEVCLCSLHLLLALWRNRALPSLTRLVADYPVHPRHRHPEQVQAHGGRSRRGTQPPRRWLLLHRI